MSNPSFENVLFIGTGGGNDIFSTTLAMASLWNLGWRWEKCAIAGVLSPFHRHTLDHYGVSGVSTVNSKSQRFLLRRDDQRQISFVDAAVSAMIADNRPYQAETVLGLSLEHGTHGLKRSFQRLNNFDYFVLVDIGGDIFYGGQQDGHVLSPMFDAMVLRAFVDSGVSGVLFEAGPGTDGEISPERLKFAFNRSQVIAYPLQTEVIEWWEELYKRWIESVRTGRTIPKTIEAFRSTEQYLNDPYRARAHLGKRRWYVYFDHCVATALCKQFYLVDPSKIDNPFALACSGPRTWFDMTQLKRWPTNNEANLEYISLRRKGKKTEQGEKAELWQFLTPSPLLIGEDRIDIINVGLQELSTGAVCDGVWIYRSDWDCFPGNKDQFVIDKSKYSNLLRVRVKS